MKSGNHMKCWKILKYEMCWWKYYVLSCTMCQLWCHFPRFCESFRGGAFYEKIRHLGGVCPVSIRPLQEGLWQSGQRNGRDLMKRLISRLKAPWNSQSLQKKTSGVCDRSVTAASLAWCLLQIAAAARRVNRAPLLIPTWAVVCHAIQARSQLQLKVTGTAKNQSETMNSYNMRKNK